MCRLQRLYYQRVFRELFLHMSDVTFDMKHNSMEVHKKRSEPWKVTMLTLGNQP